MSQPDTLTLLPSSSSTTSSSSSSSSSTASSSSNPLKVPALFGCPCIWSHVPLYGAALPVPAAHHAAAGPASLTRRLPPDVILCIVDALFALAAPETALGYDKYWESSCLPYERAKYCPFCMLPRFAVWRDVANLASTCRALRAVVTPLLYRRDAQLNHSSALLIATKRGNAAAVGLSLAHGGRVDESDHTMPLQWTNECFRYCTQCEYQVWWREPRKLDMTALHWAAVCGRAQILGMLVAAGAGPADVNRRAPVYPVLEAGNFGSLRYVETYCDEYNASFPCDALRSVMAFRGDVDCDGASALYFLLGTGGLRAERETLAMARMLVDAGASLLTHEGAGIHALHQAAAACEGGRVVEYLVKDKETEVDVTDAVGNTALHHHLLARFRKVGVRDTKVLEMLVALGADIERRNGQGLSAMDLCLDTAVVTEDKFRVAMYLVKRGAVISEELRYRSRLGREQWIELHLAMRDRKALEAKE
ncbi:Ankyrin repeat-containing protein [Colletotrichum orbiculare MAFF 240422]|uniref:Ankyrin repeat-containing protein n=1 Tax=Colletotrichum orbiculare (strain 104-T / ATCC 96160 / CBS 514.97 / LARS 414 / MAFF 240422) TaxID=1213857 RepID=N4VA05_COLOR|nr:Ankyrin repeat-containing protein [Colletotrichum orbiculare MAFF 240422]